MTNRLTLVLLLAVATASAATGYCAPVNASAQGAGGTQASRSTESPYPQSPVIESIAWHWETHTTAAPGSDLWPVAWGPDDHLYAAWGDGGGFGGSDSDGRVAMGFARIEGGPEHWRGINVNGGKGPEHPASFARKGKTTGVAVVDGVLYATINLEDGTWPDVNHALAWSTNQGATWTRAEWLFPRGAGNFQPAKFLSFGKDYTGVPGSLAGYVYVCGPRQSADRGSGNRLYLARAPRNRLRERAAYEFFQKVDAAGTPVWVAESAQAQPVFTDPKGVTPGSVVYNPGLKRYLLTCFHVGPGQLGVFDAPNPWGPWTTIAYYEDWGKMGADGEGLTCGFPQKWMSADGLTLWSIFSVYGDGAKKGINAHDRFNLVKATLQPLAQKSPGAGKRGVAEKFIPSFAICYSDAKGARSPEETARFDMLVVSFSKRAARVWGRDGQNSWQTLKALNPNLVVAPYAMGPGEYNTSEWGQIGEGWQWLKEHHGKDAADRWVAVGRNSGGYLRAVPYPNERLMEYGNTNWHRYWSQTIYQDYWQGRKGIDCRGADGLFSDNTSFQVAWAGQWRMEAQPGRADFPTSYYIDGAWRHDLWKADFFKFLNTAVPWFASNQVKLVLNVCYLGRDPETWKELDALPNPPYAAMEEGGFVCPWGGDQKSFKFWEWEKKLAPFSQLRHVKALMCNHAGPFAGQGLAAMDSPDANGMTGWDALWFSLTSFLLGFDDVSRNGLMNFTIWSYSEYHWFDEFDPQYLHLGKALGPFAKRGQVHFREFEDGWVAVNGDARDASGIRVPNGSARVLNHSNFKHWEQAPLITSFDLPAHRGVVLLREGKQAGNADNLPKPNK